MPGLTTVAQVKGYLIGIGEAIPATHDTLLQFIIDAVSVQVEEFCRRKFTQAIYTERQTGQSGQQHLFPKQAPVGTITSVKITDGSTTTTITEGTNSDNYRKVNDAAGNVVAFFRADGWKSDAYGIEVIYQGGYAAIPKDLEQAVVQLSTDDYLHRGKTGLTQESFAGMSISLDRWPMEIVHTLRKYQRPLI